MTSINQLTEMQAEWARLAQLAQVDAIVDACIAERTAILKELKRKRLAHLQMRLSERTKMTDGVGAYADQSAGSAAPIR